MLHGSAVVVARLEVARLMARYKPPVARLRWWWLVAATWVVVARLVMTRLPMSSLRIQEVWMAHQRSIATRGM